MISVKAFAPATVANVSCGFDIFGFAVNEPGDTVCIEPAEHSVVKISQIHGDGGRIPYDADKNTASVAVKGFLEHIGSSQGVNLQIFKQMPLGSGMGSSAASAAAAVFAVNTAFGSPLTKPELLPFLLKAELAACGTAHGDNVAASLLGGFILVRSYEPLDIVQIPVNTSLVCSLVLPDIEIRTEDARGVLPQSLDLKEAVAQWGNTAALATGLCTGNADLIFRSIEDHVAEPYRKESMPFFDAAKTAALRNGARAFGISGSGPALFMLAENQNAAVKAANSVQVVLQKQNIHSRVYTSAINMHGAKIITDNGEMSE